MTRHGQPSRSRSTFAGVVTANSNERMPTIAGVATAGARPGVSASEGPIRKGERPAALSDAGPVVAGRDEEDAFELERRGDGLGAQYRQATVTYDQEVSRLWL